MVEKLNSGANTLFGSNDSSAIKIASTLFYAFSRRFSSTMTNNFSSSNGFTKATMAKGTSPKQVRFVSKYRLEVVQAAGKVLNINKIFLSILNIIADNDRSLQIKDTLGKGVTLKPFT